MVRVFNHWVSPRKAVYFLAEEAVLVVALLAGAALGPVAATSGGAAGAPVTPALARAALASLFFAGALYLGDLYDVHAAVRDRADGRRLLRALGVATIALAVADVALATVLPGWMLHRSLVLAATGGALGVLAARALMPAVVGSPTRVLFLGAGTRARDLARAVEREADGLWEVVGFALPPGATAHAVADALVRAGPVDQIAREVRAQVVVVALEDRRERLPLEALLSLRTQGGRVVDDVSFAEAALQRIPLGLVRPSALIFEEGFRVSRATRTTKRAVDVLGAATLLVLLAPVMLLVALAILLTDGAPVLYAQERTGQGGRTYRIRKFRTMRRDAEQRGAAWATDRDPRVLPVGRVLRKARLDELPQLWNVLRGDMSLVGPRPEREVFLRDLKARYPLFRLRELAKPGLSGWAQLKYGYGSTVEEQGRKLEYDLYYIKNTSLFLDLVCLLATAKVVLLGRGAR